MRFFVKLFGVFVVTTLIGSAWTDVESYTTEDGGITSVTTEGAVLPDYCKWRSSVYREVTHKGNMCAENGATILGSYRLWRAQTLDGFRSFFTGYCDRKATVQECLARRASEFKICRNDDKHRSFEIYRDILESVLESGCYDGGEKLAIIWNGLKELHQDDNTTAKDAIDLCIERCSSVLETAQVPNADISSFTFILHRVLHNLTECITKIQVDQPLKDAALYFSSEILRKFKCIHPVKGSLVECESVASSMFALPSVCHVFTNNYQLDPYDEMEGVSTRIILFRPFWHDLERTIKLGNYFQRSFCSHLYYQTTRDINKLLFFSETCLDDRHNHEFKVLVDSLKDMKDPVCKDNGQAITDVMVAFLSRNNFTAETNISVVCNEFPELTTLERSNVTSKNMHFYREIKALKECLVKKLEGDEKGVEVTTLLGNAMLKKVQCFLHENNTTVPCHTIVTEA